MERVITEEEIEGYPIDMQAKIWIKKDLIHTQDDMILVSDLIDKGKISPENIELFKRLFRILMNKETALRKAIVKDGTDFDEVPYIKEESH